MHASRLLPIASGIVLLMVLFIGMKSCRQDGGDPALLGQVPKAPAPDADSPADTIRTLTAEVASIKAQNEALARENRELIEQRREIADEVKSKVREELERGSAFERLTSQMENLKGKVEDIGSRAMQAGSDIPLGLGIGPDAKPVAGPVSAITWIEPLDAEPEDKKNKTGGGWGGTSGGSLLHRTSAASATGAPVQTAAASVTEEREPDPAYTVPRNATLIGSTGMTALIGRIPFDGQVQDPFPFKVIVGRDNLAANGLDIPGVYGMIFSGEAFGDWALSCVRGKIKSVTYVFDDGTIRTLSSDDNSLTRIAAQRQGGADSTQQNVPLGWISDRRGIPCVSGQRISNAASFLTGRVLARAAEAAAKGFSLNESTRQVSPLTGVVTDTVTGDAAKFAGLNALSGGAEEISEYLKERMAQSFDVVYVDTGAEVAIHIDRELPIDYDFQGRKLTYARSTPDFGLHGLD